MVATKKYRGKMKKVSKQLIEQYSESYDLDKKVLWIIYTIGFSDEVRTCVEEAAKELNYEQIYWIQANGVITTHGGPAAFGMAGFSK